MDFKGNEKLLYLTPDMFLGKTIKQTLPEHVSKMYYKAIKKTLETKEPTVIEYALPINNTLHHYEARNLYFSENLVAIFVRDITKRKKLEQELLNEKKFIETIINAQEDTFFVFEPSNGKAIRWNNAFSEISGYSNEEIAKMKAPDSFYSEFDLEKAKIAIKEVNNKGMALLEMDLITKDGNSIPFEYLGTNIKDEEGNTKYIISIGRNITERKRMEQKLKESEEKYRNLFINSPLGIFIFDENGNLLEGNTSYLNSFSGFPSSFSYGKNFIEIIKLFKNSEELLQIFKKREEDRAKGKELKPMEIELIRQDGEKRWLLWQSSTVPLKDKILIQALVQDITDHKTYEQKLKESEEKFRTITEQSLMGICIVQDNRIEYINEAYAAIFGYNVEEMMNWEFKDVFNAIHPDDREFALEQLAKKQRGDKDIVIHYQYRGITKSGKIIWVDQFSKPIMYRDKPANFITLIDITDRKKAEERLKQSERKFKDERDNLINMLNSMEDGVYIINQQYEIEFVNPSLKNAFGPIKNKKCYEYFQNISKPCPWCKTQEDIKQGSIRWEWDSPITNKFYEIIATPIKTTNRNFSKLVIFHDITKRKKATNKLKIARERADMYLNLAGVILVALDKDGNITLLNRKGYDILEYEEGELEGHNWFDICIPSRHKDRVFKVFKKLMMGKAELVEFYENPIITKNGKEKIIAWHNILLYDKDGNANGTLSSGEDITQHRKAEKDLKKLSKLKSELLTRTSHELKTPVLHIKGYADLLLMKYKNNFGIDELQIISHIKKGVLRLETLIYDILHKAELDTDTTELRIEINDLSSLIKLSTNELRSFAMIRGHSIKLDIADSLLLEFDKTQIRHVINNLITNAIKYTPLNGLIGIRSIIEDDFITIAVFDNGIGFTEKEKRKIFSQFGKIERYGQGYDIITEGSGLGLYIAKKIIELHGGKIWLESDGRNKGSTFYFSLPR